MDDFLHNLRSGKLKQQDRSNRPYNDQQYKGGQRRPMVDRRKKENDNRESLERLTLLKEVLENLAETQKRIATAHEARNIVEERKANAMEVLAKNIYQMLNPKVENIDALFAPQKASDNLNNAKTEQESASAQAEKVNATWEGVDKADDHVEATQQTMDEEPKAEESSAEGKQSTKLTLKDQETLFPIIGQMRKKGNGWERIARHIADQGYPTLSGKSHWRGVMVKNLFEKMSA